MKTLMFETKINESNVYVELFIPANMAEEEALAKASSKYNFNFYVISDEEPGKAIYCRAMQRGDIKRLFGAEHWDGDNNAYVAL